MNKHTKSRTTFRNMYLESGSILISAQSQANRPTAIYRTNSKPNFPPLPMRQQYFISHRSSSYRHPDLCIYVLWHGLPSNLPHLHHLENVRQHG